MAETQSKNSLIITIKAKENKKKLSKYSLQNQNSSADGATIFKYQTSH
jgi:hypothetical protein